MLLENQKVKITISKRNVSMYKSYGYSNITIGDEILIDVNQLSKGSHQKVDVKCDYCGRIIKVAYRDYINYKYDKYSCKCCRQIKTNEYNLRHRQEDLYDRAIDFCNEMGYKLLTKVDEIKNSETRVLYVCPKHGIHETKIYTLIGRHKCIDCSAEELGIQSRKSSDEVYNDFKKYGGILLNKDSYTGWNDKNLIVICNECGEKFTTSYSSFMAHNGQLCPKCASNISKGEHKIKSFLEKNNVRFCMQHRFNDCKNHNPLPFDFFLPTYNLCIEYDGEGHYIPIKKKIQQWYESRRNA